MAGRIMELALAIKGKLDGSVTSSMQRVISESRQLQSQIRQANQAMRDAQRAADAEQRATGHVSEAQYRHIAELQARINNLTQRRSELLDAQARQQEAQARFDSATGSLKSTLVTGAVLAAPLVAATKAAMDFESKMADVKKVVDFDDDNQFKQMSNDVLELSQRLPMAAEGIAAIVAAGGQSGIAREDLMNFAESATKMGIAFDITAEQAGDMMAKWRTAFKMGQDDVVGLADKINYLGNTTAASAPLISDVVTRIGPLGEIGGVASGEIAALGASMVGTGVQSEVAATGIKNLILGMVAGEGATKSQAAAFQSLGMDATTMAQRMQTDAKGAIMDVFKAIQGLDKYKQGTVLADLFGKESIGAISPLLSNLDALQENFDKVADASKYAGSMEDEYAARSQTTENQLQLTKNTLMAVAISIGSALLPAVNGILGAVAPVVASFASWAGKNKELVQIILAVAGGLLGLVIAMKTVFAVQAGWDLLIAKLTTFGLVEEGTTAGTLAHTAAMKMQAVTTKVAAAAQAAFNAVMAANPIAMVVIAIGALIAAMVYLFNTNQEFHDTVIAAWEEIKAAAMEVWNAIAPILTAAWEGIKAAAQAGIDFLKGLWASIAPSVMAGVSMIVPIFSGIVNVVKTIIATGLRLWATYIRTWISVVGSIIQGIVSAVQTVWSVLTSIWSAGSNAVNVITETLGAVFSGIWDGLSSAASAAWAVVTAVVSAGRSVIESIVQGLEPIFSAVWYVFGEASAAVMPVVTDVMNTIQAVISAVSDTISGIFGSLWGGVGTTTESAWSGITGSITGAIDSVKGVMQSLAPIASTIWGGLSSAASAAWSVITGIVSAAVMAIGAVIRFLTPVFTTVWAAIVNVASVYWTIISTVIKTAINVIATIIRSLVPIFSAVWSVLKVVAKVAFIAIAVVALPIIAAIGAAVVAMGAVIYAVWQAIKLAASVAWAAISVIVQVAMAIIVPIVQAAGALISAVWSIIRDTAIMVWNAIVMAVTAAIDAIMPVVEAAGEFIGEIWNTVMNGAITVWNMISAVVNAVISVIMAIAGAAAAFIISCWNSIYNAAISAWNAIVDTVTSVWSTIQSVVDAGVAAVTAKWEQLKSIFSSPIQAVVNFVKGGDSGAADASGVDVSANAAGGIYRRGAFLTTFAEEGPEAAIPLNGSARAISLWEQAGRMMGLIPEQVRGANNLAVNVNPMAGGMAEGQSQTSSLMPMPSVKVPAPAPSINTSDNITVDFNPTINISGGAGADMQGMIRSALAEARAQLERELPGMLSRVKANQRRFSYE